MPAPDGLALLIGKRLDKKKGEAEKSAPSFGGMSDDEPELGGGQEEIEDSAISDFMNAKDPATAKAALKDFLEACYPQLAGSEPEEEEATEPPPMGA